MKNKNNKLIAGIFLVGLLFVSYCSFISAIGVSIEYSRDRPLIIAPGESQEFVVLLKAMPNEGNVTFSASILNGSNVVNILDSSAQYPVTSEKDGVVNVRANIPPNSPEGSEYLVTFKFQDVTPSTSGGSATLKGSIEPSMIVKVQNPPPQITPANPITPKTEETGISALWIILAIVLVIAIIMVIYLMIKSSSHKR